MSWSLRSSPWYDLISAMIVPPNWRRRLTSWKPGVVHVLLSWLHLLSYVSGVLPIVPHLTHLMIQSIMLTLVLVCNWSGVRWESNQDSVWMGILFLLGATHKASRPVEFHRPSPICLLFATSSKPPDWMWEGFWSTFESHNPGQIECKLTIVKEVKS